MATAARPASIRRVRKPSMVILTRLAPSPGRPLSPALAAGSRPNAYLPRCPFRQLNPQRPPDRLVGAHQVVIDLHAARLVAQPLAEALEVLQVFLAQLVGVHQQLVAADLQVTELRPLLEWERHLLRGEDVEQQ